ncbi:MAG: hypothetical protein IJP42_06480 [Selenomonadaceae bacterium]|nr:hypothetical protein [Selenomonadaceae bacterium]MBQ6758713.1 hypothetical protein [Selenomonadaceae bacterium]MBR0102030.1 hypothetical protein [Selenomonadaceae bacterium]
MNDIKARIRELRAEQRDRERYNKNVREQIEREERKLILMDREMEKIRQDIRDLKSTINYLRENFT